MLALLVAAQNFAGAFDYAAWEASEARDFDAIALVCAAFFNAA